jgi:hypothetical protein
MPCAFGAVIILLSVCCCQCLYLCVLAREQRCIPIHSALCDAISNCNQRHCKQHQHVCRLRGRLLTLDQPCINLRQQQQRSMSTSILHKYPAIVPFLVLAAIRHWYYYLSCLSNKVQRSQAYAPRQDQQVAASFLLQLTWLSAC